MPYIPEHVRSTAAVAPETPGDLNYAITITLKRYLDRWQGNYSYKDLNDILGAIEGAKLEFYRRVVVPYEDKKMEQNGDVY